MIVGRTAEFERIDRLLTAVVEGRGERLLVVGDPGIGKTALLALVGRRAARRGIRVLAARAVEGEDELPFALLDDLGRGAGQEPSRSGALIAARSEVLLSMLRRFTLSEPLLLTVDDAQFADASSLAALAVAVERAADRPLLVVLATRPDRAVQERYGSWGALRLAPLDAEASVALLRAALPPDQDGAVLSALAHALQGNPLALLEAPRLLTPDQLSGRAELPDALPVGPALNRAWGSVLDQLPDRTRRAMVALAVTGSRQRLADEVARAIGSDLAALDAATGAGLVAVARETGPAFSHPLVRDVVLGRTSPADLRAAHAAAAAAAARLDLPPDVVLQHLVRSVTAADAAVADALVAQARRAEQREQLETAARAWAEAARLTPTVVLRRERALCGLRAIADHGVAVSAIATLVELMGDAPLDPTTKTSIDWMHADDQMDKDLDVARRALWSVADQARTTAPALVPLVLWDLVTAANLAGDNSDAERAARACLAWEAQACGPAAPGAPWWIGTGLLAVALFQAGDTAAARGLRDRAVRAAAEVDPRRTDLANLLAVVFLDDLLLDLGAAAGDRIAVAARRCHKEAEPLACLAGLQAWRSWGHGDVAGTAAFLAQGLPLAEATHAAVAVCGMTALIAERAARNGEDEVFQDAAATVRYVAGSVRDRRRVAVVDRAGGVAALGAGRLDEAATALCAAADLTFLGRGLRDGVLPARVDMIETLVRLGDREEASRRRDALHPLLEGMADPLASALDVRSAALLTCDPGEADRAFQRAEAYHRRASDPFEEGRTLLLHGEHLRRHRRRTEARAPLLRASQVFAQLGAAPWRDRAGSELRACGGHPAAPAASGRLTPQELAVARVVAAGRSNQETADVLFLSPRTVEYHLSSVYRKLGVRGRGALAQRLPTVVSDVGLRELT